MKIFLLLTAITWILTAGGCKKEPETIRDEGAMTKKYARFKTGAYGDRELKKVLTSVSKGEPVDLLGFEKVSINKREIDVSRIRLSGDRLGFLKSEFLAEKPAIFTEETKSYVKNSAGSESSFTIPMGALGFIVEEKANWTRIFFGNIYTGTGTKKWIEDKWVQGGFVTDEKMIPEACAYEEASFIMADNSSSVKDFDTAREILTRLKNGNGIYSELGKIKLAELDLRQGNSPEVDLTHDNAAMEKSRVVTSKGGLRLRESPDLNGTKIDLIPEGGMVELLEVSGDEVTISGTTGRWSRVRWKHKTGWVFGGFLSVK